MQQRDSDQMAKQNLNGSVNLLADAMRKVFTESVENAIEPLTQQVKALRTEVHDMEGHLNKRIDTTNKNMQEMEGRLNKSIDATNENMQVQFSEMEGRLNKSIDTTNENMQVQFSEQEKKIGKLIKERRPSS